MRLDEPSWWYEDDGSRLAPRALAPISEIYASAVERRFRTATPYRAALPVICVGNFTAGGTGKTPLTRFLIDDFARLDARAVCLSRGYGGSLAGPVWVDPDRHSAREVGDEPLLIARGARVMIARDRKAGMVAIEAVLESGAAGAVIMDDGLQNPGLVKDLSIAVVDARRGFGNGRVIPSGPLRARLDFQLTLVDCIVVMGADPPDGVSPVFEDLKRRFDGPVLRGAVEVVGVAAVEAGNEAGGEPRGAASWLTGQSIVAYAGIANPNRFFNLVESFAPRALAKRAFPDHHEFTEADADALMTAADADGALLVTTEKDLARLSGATGRRAELAARSRALPIRVKFEDRDLLRLRSLIEGTLKTNRGTEKS